MNQLINSTNFSLKPRHSVPTAAIQTPRALRCQSLTICTLPTIKLQPKTIVLQPH